MPTSPHYPLGERGGIRGKGRCGQCGPQAAFQSATAAQRRHLAQRSALRETSPMTPGQARFVDPARPRHPTRERQRVLGCRSMQVSGAGVESHAPPTAAGLGKGGVALFSPSFGYFSWRSKKSTNIPCDLGPQPQETACGRDGEKDRLGIGPYGCGGRWARNVRPYRPHTRPTPAQPLAAKRWPGRIFRSI